MNPNRTSTWLGALLLLATCGAGCAEGGVGGGDTGPPAVEIEILDVQTPGDLIPGTPIGVQTRGVDVQGEGVRLEIRSPESGYGSFLDALETPPSTSLVEFRASSDLVGTLGLGPHAVEMRIHQGERASDPFQTEITLANEVSLFLEEAPFGTFYRNDEVVLRGSGFISPDEGILEAELNGTFRAEGASAEPLIIRLPIAPAERYSRDRGVLQLTTEVGGIWPGVFEGTIQLQAAFPSGETRSSTALATQIAFQRPALFSIEPRESVLGEILTVQGGGFLGGSERSNEATVLRLQGSLITDEGLTLSFGPEEAVLVYQDGQTGEWPVEFEVRGRGLISSFFGLRSGRFTGTARVVTIYRIDELSSDSIDLDLELRGVRQILVVRFLPGFYDSLRHYGLGSASVEVERVALERMRRLYAPYAVDIVTEPPSNFIAGAIATLEIGGPDPNGLGLLGYDNTPGKDVGNVRLHDTIGGANAQTQADGFPGYGGVFIDSFLYWSTHPDLPGDRPIGSPEPDPLFDEIFDPVRSRPATLEEAEGAGDPGRVAEVQRAINALGSMVGETSAHEFGHSLGLAQPFGSETAYHSPFPGEGCLMDAGADRPFGERTVQSGYAETHFCYDEPEYLLQILPP